MSLTLREVLWRVGRKDVIGKQLRPTLAKITWLALTVCADLKGEGGDGGEGGRERGGRGGGRGL